MKTTDWIKVLKELGKEMQANEYVKNLVIDILNETKVWGRTD